MWNEANGCQTQVWGLVTVYRSGVLPSVNLGFSVSTVQTPCNASKTLKKYNYYSESYKFW